MKEIQLVLPRASKRLGRDKKVTVAVHAVGCEAFPDIAEEIRSKLQKMLDDRAAGIEKEDIYNSLENDLRGLWPYGKGGTCEPWIIAVDYEARKIKVQNDASSPKSEGERQSNIQNVFDEVAARIFK